MLTRLPVFLCLLLCQLLLKAGTIAPSNLQCENLTNPVGIQVALPMFSWNIESGERNQTQTAYELIVSDNVKDITNQKGNLWTSGKIITNNTINVQFGGASLQSTKRYFWRVKAYDKKGEPSAWSDVATFETAMLRQDDWAAKWISDGSKNAAEDKMLMVSTECHSSEINLRRRKKLNLHGYIFPASDIMKPFLMGKN